MALGERIIYGSDVLSHIRHMENTLVSRDLHNRIDLRRYYVRDIGNFNIVIFNHYLSRFPWNQERRFVLRNACSDIPAGGITKELVENTLKNAAYSDGAILTTTNDNGQGHAVALKKIFHPTHSNYT